MHKPLLKVSALALVAFFFLAGVAAHAAPMLGVQWRAAANPTGKPQSGVKILSVDPAGNGAELGLQAGDTVLAINGVVVNTGQEATAQVVKALGKITLLVLDGRTGAPVTIKADIDAPVAGLVADPNAKAKYKNVVRSGR